MIRIFMAPKTDERGTDMFLKDQRLLMIEMDKFVVSRKLNQKLYISSLY
jgi:tyrosinase